MSTFCGAPFAGEYRIHEERSELLGTGLRRLFDQPVGRLREEDERDEEHVEWMGHRNYRTTLIYAD
jgi:hypothetical protein